jgi:hypothetical protein
VNEHLERLTAAAKALLPPTAPRGYDGPRFTVYATADRVDQLRELIGAQHYEFDIEVWASEFATGDQIIFVDNWKVYRFLDEPVEIYPLRPPPPWSPAINNPADIIRITGA